MHRPQAAKTSQFGIDSRQPSPDVSWTKKSFFFFFSPLVSVLVSTIDLRRRRGRAEPVREHSFRRIEGLTRMTDPGKAVSGGKRRRREAMVDVDGGRRGRMTTLRGSTAGAAHTKRRLSATGQQGESCYIVQETNSSGRPRGQLVTAAVRTQARCHGSAATTGDARFAHGTRQIELSFARVRPSGTSTGAGHSGRWYSGWRTRYTDGEGTGVEQARGQEERRVRRTCPPAAILPVASQVVPASRRSAVKVTSAAGAAGRRAFLNGRANHSVGSRRHGGQSRLPVLRTPFLPVLRWRRMRRQRTGRTHGRCFPRRRAGPPARPQTAFAAGPERTLWSSPDAWPALHPHYSGPKCSGKFPASASSLSPGPELRRTTRTSLGREEALSGVTTAAPSPFSPQVTSDPASLGPSLALPKVKKTDDRPVPRSLGELGLVARHLHLVLDIINSTVPPVLRPRPCPVLVLVAGRGADCWLLDDMRAVPCHPPVSVSENRRLGTNRTARSPECPKERHPAAKSG
ncbi:hypothetical protein VTN96DRAFT_5580 [Rasamsonia emersonii]